MQLFRFANPEFLYLMLLLPVMVLLFIFNTYRRKRSLKKLGDSALMTRLMPEISETRPLLNSFSSVLAISAS